MKELYSKSRLPRISNDRRGTIHQASFAKGEYSVVQMRVGSLRGGHYHSRETFHLVVQGRILFELIEPSTKKRRQITAGPMDIIHVRAGVAHLLLALEESLFLEPSKKHGTTVDFEPQRAQVLRFLKPA